MPDAPDGTLMVEIAITVGGSTVPPSAASELAIVALDRLTTSSASYQTVVSYTVPASKTFLLAALEIACSDYTLGQFRVTIAGVVQFADEYLQTTFNPQFGNAHLAAGDVVLIEAKSDGATSIDVDGAIEGKVVG